MGSATSYYHPALWVHILKCSPAQLGYHVCLVSVVVRLPEHRALECRFQHLIGTVYEHSHAASVSVSAMGFTRLTHDDRVWSVPLIRAEIV